jgi:hypothetical protein
MRCPTPLAVASQLQSANRVSQFRRHVVLDKYRRMPAGGAFRIDHQLPAFGVNHARHTGVIASNQRCERISKARFNLCGRSGANSAASDCLREVLGIAGRCSEVEKNLQRESRARRKRLKADKFFDCEPCMRVFVKRTSALMAGLLALTSQYNSLPKSCRHRRRRPVPTGVNLV